MSDRLVAVAAAASGLVIGCGIVFVAAAAIACVWLLRRQIGPLLARHDPPPPDWWWPDETLESRRVLAEEQARVDAAEERARARVEQERERIRLQRRDFDKPNATLDELLGGDTE